MKHKLLILHLFVAGLLSAGCANNIGGRSGIAALEPGADTIRPVARPNGQGQAPDQNAATVEEFDTTTDAERTAAQSDNANSAEVEIGRTIASLGNPAEPGFWLETPLVTQAKQGRVVNPANGNSVAVDLIAAGGPVTGGSRISLAAMRLLGLELTGLPELIVYAQ